MRIVFGQNWLSSYLLSYIVHLLENERLDSVCAGGSVNRNT